MSDYIKTEKVLDLLAGVVAEIVKMPPEHTEERTETHSCVCEHTETHDLISRKEAIDALNDEYHGMISDESMKIYQIINWLSELPYAEPETIVRCKDCKDWVRQTYQGTTLSWGHCESEHMWDSLYGETYEVAYINTNEEHFCGYAERRTNE